MSSVNYLLTLLFTNLTSFGTPQESTNPPPTSNAATARFGTPQTARCKQRSAAAGPPQSATVLSLSIFLYLSEETFLK